RTDEAYAVFVQKYFGLPENRDKKTVSFQKRQHRFAGDGNWQRLLLDGSAPRRLGLAFPASPSPEELSSNLLEAVLPKTVWSGTTALEKRLEVTRALRKLNFAEGEIIVSGKR